MNPRYMKLELCLASVAMLLTAALSARGDDPAAPPAAPSQETTTVVVQTTPDDAAPESGTITVNVDVVKPGQYWLGVICSPLEDELLMAHLGIDHGILVQEVVDDSPAAKAGLQKHDILVQAGEHPLKDLKTLVECTEQAQENALTLTFIRKGQQQTLAVTPTKRPARPPQPAASPDKEARDEWNMLQENLRDYVVVPHVVQPGEQLDGTKMLFVMPGFVLPEQAKDFPKDLEVIITKKGEEDTKITVKRGDEQWDVDATSLDKLPADIRPHVKQMLGGQVSMTIGGDHVNWSTSNFPKPLVLPKITPDVLKKSFKVAPNMRIELRGLADKIPSDVREKVHQRLKEAQQKLEEAQTEIPAATLDKIQNELKGLREQLEQLRAERAEKAGPKAEADKDTTETDK
jgi:hypothetical protein